MTTLTDVFVADNDLLGIFPARPTDIRIGYARVSTGGQKLDRQIDALTLAGCRRIFPEKKSGKNDLRPELKACHAFLQAGDTLVVPSLDRYGRSLQNLVNMVAALRTRQIGFTSLHESLDTTTPGGRLIFHVFAALAEFIRELIVQGTNEGLAAARARGRVGGRPSVVNDKLLRAARDMLPNPRTASRPSRPCSASRSAPSTTTSLT
ncbi:recombinase family protein [Streptomyces sp. NPDC002602]|uniref:recombinase family protein n=1 Tax=Streptomyces sp. NPDC002602 TaxID=3364654 RepID=UPI00368F4DC3